MTKPEVVHCADGHYRRAVYGIGPDIADYPEQCLHCSIVQGWCPRCMANRKDLDGPGKKDKRTKELIEVLKETFPDKDLWKDWGIFSGVTVSHLLYDQYCSLCI